MEAMECVSEHGKSLCKAAKGTCVVHTDGYYIVSAICMSLGVILVIAFILPTARKLQSKVFCPLRCPN